jgi:hypothetical protein
MKTYLHGLRLLSLAALSLAALGPASAQRYTVTDLGKDNRPLALNSSGQVVGYHNVSGSSTYGFLWTPTTPSAAAGTMTTLLTGNVRPYSINVSGQVVGKQSVQDASGAYHDYPFVWTPDVANGTTGSWINLNTTLPANSGWVLHNAGGINDAGAIFGGGTYTDAAGVAVNESYLWQMDRAGNIVLAPALLLGESASLNNLASPQAAAGRFIWQNGVRTPINSSFPNLQIYSINDLGQVAGKISPLSMYHAFVWTPDVPNGTTSTAGPQDLHPAGYYWSYARSLNNAGQVVGVAQLTSSSVSALGSLWDRAGWHDLNMLCNPLPAGWKLQQVYGINNRTVSVNGILNPAAQITGTGVVTVTTTTIVHNKVSRTTTAEEHGFLLTPQ